MSQDLRRFEQCPSCGVSSAKAKHLFRIQMLGEACSVLQCQACRLVYKELAPTIAGLAKIYCADYTHFEDKSAATDLAGINSAKQKLSRCQQLLKISRPPSELRLIDVGCGAGGFVRVAQNLGYLADGIDPYLPEQLQSTSLQQKSPDLVSPHSYDIAVLLNVAEHLDRPRQMFSAVRQLLKPGGVMLLTCPYGDSFARHLHQSNWGHLALDEHLLFWNPRSLTHLLRELGFQGKVNYRIGGCPFPYGRMQQQSVAIALPMAVPECPAPKQNKDKQTLQSRIWQFARTIQRQETTANLVRHLIHLSRSGDYLEYAIAVEK